MVNPTCNVLKKGGQVMDKPREFKTITIKINGKERSGKEKNSVKMDSPTSKSTDENKKVHEKVIDENVEKQYKKIDEITSQQSAVAKEENDEDSFEWILPEIEKEEGLKEFKIADSRTKENKKDYKEHNHPIKNVKNKGFIPSFMITVFFAVVIGTTFGVVLLKMVISDTAVETTGIPSDDIEESVKEEGASVTASIKTAPIKGYVIQGGAFSSLESAKTIESTIASKGVPTKVIQLEEKFYIFIGLADNLGNAKAIGSNLWSSGIENFSKEIEFGGKTDIKINDTEKNVLEIAPLIYQKILTISTNAALSNSIPSTEIKSEEWKKIDVNSIENGHIQQLKLELDGALQGLTSFKEKKDSKFIVEIQQHLLNFLAIYHSI